jgi:hypothetical protein
MMNETVIHEDILSLIVYLCELAIDDVSVRETIAFNRFSLPQEIRRSKYGEFLNGYAPSATEPPQCHTNNSGMNDSVSLETLTSLEDENTGESDQREVDLPGIDPISHQPTKERLTEIEQCYTGRVSSIL